MTTPAQRKLAQALLAQELSDGSSPEAPAEAAVRVCQKLSVRLVVLVSHAGSRALLGRALHLARIEFPFLSSVRVGTDPLNSLEGLYASVQGIAPAQVDAGLTSIVAGIIGLLNTFIGEDLTGRLVRDVWADAPAGDAARVVPEA